MRDGRERRKRGVGNPGGETVAHAALLEKTDQIALERVGVRSCRRLGEIELEGREGREARRRIFDHDLSVAG